jgi:hypothetical protein
MGMQLPHMLGLPVSHCIWKEYQIKTHLCCIWYLSGDDASCCQLRSSLRLEHVVLAKSALCAAVGSTAFLMSKPTSKSNDKSELCPATWGLEVTAFTVHRDVQVSCGSMLLTRSISVHSAWDDGFASSVKENISQKLCNSNTNSLHNTNFSLSDSKPKSCRPLPPKVLSTLNQDIQSV